MNDDGVNWSEHRRAEMRGDGLKVNEDLFEV